MTETDLEIRTATTADARQVARLLGAMMAEMEEQSGGQPVAPERARVEFFDGIVAAGLARAECRYVVAAASGDHLLGVANAEILTAMPVFTPCRTLHISTAYVLPEHRRTGVARRLVEDLLGWGRAEGCEQADLNVLCANPAGLLYERLGFVEVQRKLLLRL